MSQYTVKRNPDFPEADSWFVMQDGISIAGPMTYADAEDWLDKQESNP